MKPKSKSPKKPAIKEPARISVVYFDYDRCGLITPKRCLISALFVFMAGVTMIYTICLAIIFNQPIQSGVLRGPQKVAAPGDSPKTRHVVSKEATAGNQEFMIINGKKMPLPRNY